MKGPLPVVPTSPSEYIAAHIEPALFFAAVVLISVAVTLMLRWWRKP